MEVCRFSCPLYCSRRRRFLHTLPGGMPHSRSATDVAPILAPRNIIDIGPNAPSPDNSRSCCARLSKTKILFHLTIKLWNDVLVLQSPAQHERELSGESALGPISIILRGARMGATPCKVFRHRLPHNLSAPRCLRRARSPGVGFGIAFLINRLAEIVARP